MCSLFFIGCEVVCGSTRERASEGASQEFEIELSYDVLPLEDWVVDVRENPAAQPGWMIDGHVRTYTAAPCAPAFLQEVRMNGMWLPRECVLSLLRAASRLKSARMVSGLAWTRTAQCLSMSMG